MFKTRNLIITASLITAFLACMGATVVQQQDKNISSKKAPALSTALLVQAEAGQGVAAPNNDQPANFLIVVTDPVTGEAVTNLTQRSFTIINHFSIPGQACGFSNNMTAFNDVGTGAYHIQVKPKGCNWVSGNYLAQVIVSSKGRNGQAAATLSVR